MKSNPLTPDEKKWMAELETLMQKAPPRIGFYTVGDHCLSAYDLSRESEINKECDRRGNAEYCTVVKALGADFGAIQCPMPIHATAG